MTNIVCWCNEFLTAHPKIKVALSTAEGAFFGAIGSTIWGWLQVTDPFNLQGLKRALTIGTTSALVAVYNLYKQPPQPK